jgi:uncharacterized protein YcfJ
MQTLPRALVHGLAALALLAAAGLTGCATDGSYENTKKGVVIGTVLGAGIGAVIGHQSGHAGEGAAIGAAAGAVLGGVSGSAVDDKNARENRATTTTASHRRGYDDDADMYP